VRPAVFLDRDGTMNEDVGHLDRDERLTLFPYSIDAVRLLNQAGYAVVVVTNQGGIAKGFVEERFVVALHERLRARFADGGAHIDRFYHCPHDPHAAVARYRSVCGCRKPEPGMVRQAAVELELDPARSFVIGDKWSDVGLARNVGAVGILVRTGYGVTQERRPDAPVLDGAAVVTDNLMSATVHILSETTR
jgi:D-glycero-D-manno-heptose 1,7-bisphosphate phosphatase